jgi:hypothetical protein
MLYISVVIAVLCTGICAQAAPPYVEWSTEYGDSGSNAPYWIEECSASGYVVAGMWAGAAGDDYDGLLMRVDTDGDTLWTRTWGDTLENSLACVRETSDGGFILAGSTERVPGDRDAWFVRTDSDGDTLWTSMFDFGIGDYLACVEEVPGGDFIACGYSSGAPPLDSLDVLVIRIDSDGTGIWKYLSQIPGNDRAIEFCRTSDGNLVTGGFVGTAADQGDILLVKVDAATGDSIWIRTYPDTAYEICSGIREAADGGLVACGGILHFAEDWGKAFLLKTDEDGTYSWRKIFGGPGDRHYASSVVVAPDGGYALGARRDTVGDGSYDCHYIRLDSAGDTLWTVTGGLPDREVLTCMTMTSDMGYVSCAEGRVLPSPDRTVVLQKLSEDEAGVRRSEAAAGPGLLAIEGANPFTGSVAVRYEVPCGGRVRLTVYDVAGRRVATLADGQRAAGSYRASWDGRSSTGRDFRSGVYFIRFESAGGSGVEKVVILR